MVKSIRQRNPCVALAEAPSSRSLHIIAATPGEPCTPFVLPKRFTFCTRSKKNRNVASTTTKRDIELIRQRLAEAERLHRKGKINHESNKARAQPSRIRSDKSRGNVFADLDLLHPEQELLRSRLTLQIYRLIRARDLKQAEAGKILGIKQPHVSAPMRNRSGSFSVERLMEFLTALGQDVEIRVRPARKQHGELSVVA